MVNKSWTTTTPPATKSENVKKKKTNLEFNGCMRFSFTSPKRAQSFEFLVFNVRMSALLNVVDTSWCIFRFKFLLIWEGKFRELKAISFDAVVATQQRPQKPIILGRGVQEEMTQLWNRTQPNETHVRKKRRKKTHPRIQWSYEMCLFHVNITSRNNENNKLAFDLLRNRNLNCILSGARCCRRGCSHHGCVCLWFVNARSLA